MIEVVLGSVGVGAAVALVLLAAVGWWKRGGPRAPAQETVRWVWRRAAPRCCGGEVRSYVTPSGRHGLECAECGLTYVRYPQAWRFAIVREDGPPPEEQGTFGRGEVLPPLRGPDDG